jgi:hypothetical protein
MQKAPELKLRGFFIKYPKSYQILFERLNASLPTCSRHRPYGMDGTLNLDATTQ